MNIIWISTLRKSDMQSNFNIFKFVLSYPTLFLTLNLKLNLFCFCSFNNHKIGNIKPKFLSQANYL